MRIKSCYVTQCRSTSPLNLDRFSPYWYWRTKVNGWIVNRQLGQRAAELYGEWTKNDLRASTLHAQICEVAGKAAERILVDVDLLPV